MQLYRKLRGPKAKENYNPEIYDELAIRDCRADIWKHSSPWSFKSPSMASEFLISWGHIMQVLALPPDSSASILEYGSGSGQLLLFLARMGDLCLRGRY